MADSWAWDSAWRWSRRARICLGVEGWRGLGEAELMISFYTGSCLKKEECVGQSSTP